MVPSPVRSNEKTNPLAESLEAENGYMCCKDCRIFISEMRKCQIVMHLYGARHPLNMRRASSAFRNKAIGCEHHGQRVSKT